MNVQPGSRGPGGSRAAAGGFGMGRTGFGETHRTKMPAVTKGRIKQRDMRQRDGDLARTHQVGSDVFGRNHAPRGEERGFAHRGPDLWTVAGDGARQLPGDGWATVDDSLFLGPRRHHHTPVIVGNHHHHTPVIVAGGRGREIILAPKKSCWDRFVNFLRLIFCWWT